MFGTLIWILITFTSHTPIHQVSRSFNREYILPPVVTTTTSSLIIRRAPLRIDWDLYASCESRNNWSDNTGNHYYGGLQENLGFWESYDGLYEFAPRPDLATKAEQIIVAERAYYGYTKRFGPRKGQHFTPRGGTPWPNCP